MVRNMNLLEFAISDELKQAYIETYTENEFKNDNQLGSALREYYERIPQDENYQKKVDDLFFIYAFERETRASGIYSQEDGRQNISEIKPGPDGKMLLTMKNLGNTGLDFAIRDNKSIVLTDESNQITAAQAEELARFFYVHGIENTEDFKLPANVSIKPDVKNPNPKSLKETFADGLLVAKNELGTPVDDFELEGNFAKWLEEEGPNAAMPAKFAGKNMNTNMSKMVSDCKAKIAISLNMRGRLVRSRMALDGSMIISCYVDDVSMRHDGENNKGDIKRSKACAFKIKVVKGRPTISCYVPDGKALEVGHVKTMLDTIKAQGAEYFTMPNALETSGKSQGAFWEAAGKTLMVPLCKTANQPDGAIIEGDHIKSILESIDKEAKGGKHKKEDVLKWKSMMLDELNEQETYREAKANDAIRKEFDTKLTANPNILSKYTEEFMILKSEGKIVGMNITDYARNRYVANTPGSYKTNSGLQDQIDAMTSSIKYENFQIKYLSSLTDFMQDCANKNIGENKSQQWDFVEIHAASRALSSLCADYGNPEFAHLTENDGKNDELQKAILLKEFKKRIETEKENVAKEIHKSIQDGEKDGQKNIRTEVVKSTQQQTTQLVNNGSEKIKEKYGVDIKFTIPRASSTSFSKELEEKHFNAEGKYLNPPTYKVSDSINVVKPRFHLTPAMEKLNNQRRA